LRATPRTDPGARNYRTGLLPRVMTCFCSYPFERMGQVDLALSPEPGLLARIPLGQTPSLQALRQARSPPLFVRALPRYYGFVRFPAAVHRGCTFTFDHADHAYSAWPTAGPPGFRAESFGTCMGSTTTRSPQASRANDVCGVAFRPKPRRRHSGPRLFRGSIPRPYLPLSTLATSPRGQTAMTRRPVWLAMPSLQETFTLHFLPAYPGASAFSPCGFGSRQFPGPSGQAGISRAVGARCAQHRRRSLKSPFSYPAIGVRVRVDLTHIGC
jgi:hypothetical protein